MRYLRMMTNALGGGILVATYLAVLVLQLNPHVPVVSTTAGRWFGALLALYGPYLTALLFVLMLLVEAVASRPLRPAWVSVRVFAWIGAVIASAAAAITWANLHGLNAELSEAAAERMRQGAMATTAFAAALVGIAVLRYSSGRRGTRAAAWLLVAAVCLSVAVPLWIRGPGELPVPAAHRQSQARPVAFAPRVRVILIDGAARGFVLQRVAAGQLPNFGKLLDRGAVIELATLRPTQAEPIWTAAATGKYPPKNGIRSEFLYRVPGDDAEPVNLLPDYCFTQALLYQGFVRAEALTAEAARARPLWSILADYGVPAGIVNWPLSSPARAELGYLISDRFDDTASSPLRTRLTGAGDPTTAADIAREAFDRWQALPAYETIPGATAEDPPPPGLRRARWDRAFAEAAQVLETSFAPRFTAIRFEGVDELGHAYLREAEPELFGNVRRGDPQRSVLDRYYAYLDSEIDRAITQTEPGDLLIVMSGYGMGRNPLAKRALARLLGEGDTPGTHEDAPDGFLIAYGTNVAPGEYRRGSIVDLAPTVLYYLGLPVGRDMDGFARTDLFRGAYTRDHPVTYIATHER